MLKPAEVVYVIGESLGFERMPSVYIEAVSSPVFSKLPETERIKQVEGLLALAQSGRSEFVHELLEFGELSLQAMGYYAE